MYNTCTHDVVQPPDLTHLQKISHILERIGRVNLWLPLNFPFDPCRARARLKKRIRTEQQRPSPISNEIFGIHLGRCVAMLFSWERVSIVIIFININNNNCTVCSACCIRSSSNSRARARARSRFYNHRLGFCNQIQIVLCCVCEHVQKGPGAEHLSCVYPHNNNTRMNKKKK